jgi:hypothetical protein
MRLLHLLLFAIAALILSAQAVGAPCGAND